MEDVSCLISNNKKENNNVIQGENMEKENSVGLTNKENNMTTNKGKWEHLI